MLKAPVLTENETPASDDPEDHQRQVFVAGIDLPADAAAVLPGAVWHGYVCENFKGAV